MIRGDFIVLEGIDGAGTTTQAAAIGRKFSEIGLPAHVTQEPSAGPVGSVIRQILTGRLMVRAAEALMKPTWRSMALLFAADRQDHLESEVMPNLEEGVNVVCDRYVYSSVIYQSLSTDNEGAEQWIKEINRFAREPDLVIYLRVQPEEALRRRIERDRKAELFDDPEFQQQLAKAYERLPRMFPDTPIVTVDANLSPEAVTEACWAEVEALRAKGAPV